MKQDILLRINKLGEELQEAINTLYIETDVSEVDINVATIPVTHSSINDFPYCKLDITFKIKSN